jgi:transposase InsO family protein
LFQAALAAVGIRHEFTALGKPWQNGRIERFFLTPKERLDRIVSIDARALQELLAQFCGWYNVVRTHNHLHGLTPWEAWRRIDPYRTTANGWPL